MKDRFLALGSPPPMDPYPDLVTWAYLGGSLEENNIVIPSFIYYPFTQLHLGLLLA